jgi:SAM-dependent methyltransferase
MRSSRTLAGFYPDTYYSFQPATEDSRLKSAFRTLLGLRRTTYLPPLSAPGRLLDVGCGSGQYLFELARLGWQVSGVEPSARAAAIGRAAGLDVHVGDILTVDLAPASFDVVRFNHSLEHMPDPTAALAAAKGFLKEDGYLVVGVPNTDSLWARVFGRWWWHLGLPVHAYAFNPSNLRALLEKAGYRIERVRYNSEFAGLLGSVQIWLNRHARPRQSTGPVFYSRVLRVPAVWLMRILDALSLGDCIEVAARPAPGAVKTAR